MFGLLLTKINRQCPVCRARIEGKGVRRGLRVFCSWSHRQMYAEQARVQERVLRWLGKTNGGGCGGCG